MRIGTNISSMVAQKHLGNANNDSVRTSMKLSSGDRINVAANDPAGLAISEKLKANINSINQARRNIVDGMSLVQVAEGSLGNINNIGIRLREIAVQCASDTLDDRERLMADGEFQALKSEISRLAQGSMYNGNHLLNNEGSVYSVQIGIGNVPQHDRYVYDMNQAMKAVTNINLTSDNVKSKEASQKSIVSLSKVLRAVGKSRANLGATSNRMQSSLDNMEIFSETTSAANSSIRDADLAHETSERAKIRLRQSAATTLLNSANHNPAYITRLVS